MDPFSFDADPDPTFQIDADPDPGSFEKKNKINKIYIFYIFFYKKTEKMCFKNAFRQI